MKTIELAQIQIDAGTQVRASISEAVVSDYAERMGEGVTFPPVVLFHDGNCYYMGDGFHRFMATQRIGLAEIGADVRPGTKADALWFALGANKTNGQRLSESDKRHAITLALTTWPDRSQNQIAEQIGCTQQWVAKVKSEIQDTTTCNLPTRVTGKDGKSYPAARSSQPAVNPKRDAVAEMVRAGKPSMEIRATLKVSPVLVAEVRREMGVGSVDRSKEAISQRKQDVRDMAERGYSSRQIASTLDLSREHVARIAQAEGISIHADRVIGKSKLHDSTRIIEHIVMDADNLTADVGLIDLEDLDPSRLAEWVASLKASRDKLGTFIRALMKEQQKHGEAA